MKFTGSGYRERHSRTTLIAFSLMLIVVIGSGYYIYTYGLSNNDRDVVITDFEVSIGFYNPAENLTANVRILYENNTVFGNLTANAEGFVVIIRQVPGSYKLYYEGIDNDITFGPVIYTVTGQNILIVDRDFVGVQVTIRTI